MGNTEGPVHLILRLAVASFKDLAVPEGVSTADDFTQVPGADRGLPFESSADVDRRRAVSEARHVGVDVPTVGSGLVSVEGGRQRYFSKGRCGGDQRAEKGYPAKHSVILC